MKNKLCMAVLTVSLCLLLSGCNSQKAKLVCKQAVSGVDITLNVGFKGKVVDTMDLLYEMDLSKYSDIQIEAVGKQDFCNIVKGAMSQYKEAFTDCNQNISNKKLSVSADFDVDKIAKNTLDKMGTPEDTKNELEKQKYTCTIEK